MSSNRTLLPLFGAAAIALAGAPAAVSAEAPAPQISVTGEGEKAIAPDMAVLNLSVVSEEKTARAALDDNNSAMASVLQALKDQEIAERDLQTSGFSIQPQYVYPKQSSGDQRPRIVGYRVSNSLTVRVRDLARLGEILALSVSLGVSQGGNIAFTNDDPSAAITEARTAAVTDAIAKATTLTAAANVGLGKILTMTEQSFTPGPVPVARAEMAMRAADAVPVAAGENTYRVRVNVTFELDQ
ncbi:MAG: SIMPL domain-containing protein [Rhizobiaceae bacterium]